MTAASSQEEILQNTKTVVQGLEALKNEHQTISNSLLQSLAAVKQKTAEDNSTSMIEDKATIVQKSLETIQLGIEEAQVDFLLKKL